MASIYQRVTIEVDVIVEPAGASDGGVDFDPALTVDNIRDEVEDRIRYLIDNGDLGKAVREVHARRGPGSYGWYPGDVPADVTASPQPLRVRVAGVPA